MSLVGDIRDVGAAFWELGKVTKSLIGNADKLGAGLVGLGHLFERFSSGGRLRDLATLGRTLSGYGDDTLRFLKNPAVARLVKAARTPILLGGQAGIAAMKLTTGFGDPEDGRRFGEGAARFTGAGSTLTAAYPDGSWAGSGAQAYSDANSRQVVRTEAMSGADRAMNAVLAREAGQIVATRNTLDGQSDWLADVGLVTMLVAATPCVGTATAMTMEIAAVTKALAVCTVQLTELAQQVNDNAAEIVRFAAEYDAEYDSLAEGTGLTSTGPDAPPPPLPPGGDQTASRGASSGAGGGGGSGGSRAAPSPQVPALPSIDLPGAPAGGLPPPSWGSSGGAGPSIAPPPLNPPPAAANPLPTAAGAGMSATLIADLVRSAVQKAMGDHARTMAQEAQVTEDGDGIPDVDQAGAAHGSGDGGRAPIHLEVDVDPRRTTIPVTVTVDRDGQIGSPSAAGR